MFLSHRLGSSEIDLSYLISLDCDDQEGQTINISVFHLIDLRTRLRNDCCTMFELYDIDEVEYDVRHVFLLFS